ncbi:tetratricopeptide repeat protein [Rubellimicrobium arenae]|uniref:tetratricopeptide repeat protein n=1 Tax=Rubellimicrobium arenae TaxID=2817372 RepID=UPI001B314AB2
MANTNESFIDEVSEAVRRDRINLWFRRWGWLAALLVLAIVGGAGWMEWQRSRTEAAAQFRGDAILTALETSEPGDRLAALSELPHQGDQGVVTALLLASEQQAAGDAEAAAATLNAVAADGTVPPLYRDLASLKALIAQGDSADPAALEALAAPGAPFRLLALEQLALVQLDQDQRDAAIANLQTIREDAGVTSTQLGRVEALLTALGVPPEDAAPAAELPAPTGE